MRNGGLFYLELACTFWIIISFWVDVEAKYVLVSLLIPLIIMGTIRCFVTLIVIGVYITEKILNGIEQIFSKDSDPID